MNALQAQGLVRTAGAVLGGGAVVAGTTNPDIMGTLSTTLTALGAVISGVVALWSYFAPEKKAA